MPRKKKGLSPARVPSGQPAEGGSRGPSMVYRPLPMGSNFIPGTSLSRSAKEDIVTNIMEMFSHLDPEVIYTVLSECDFKVENAMDSLLELSVAATEPQPNTALVSGFERTAAALLTPNHFAELRSQTDISKQLQFSSRSPTIFMTEDMDFLIDQEVQSLSAQEDAKGGQLGSQLHKLPEALKSNLEPQCSEPFIEKSPLQSLNMSGASSPLNQLSTFGVEDTQGHELVVNKHLLTETAVNKNIASLDLVTLGDPSAVQFYTEQKYSKSPPETEEVMASDAAIRKTILKSNPPKKKMDSSVPLPWNIEAPIFYPHVKKNQCPAFITPVASNWPSDHRPAIPWHRPVSQAPLRTTAAIPRSWALPSAQPLGQYSRLRLEGKVLVLLRGAPGSGKSTLARALLEHNPGGIILSTDDYFNCNGEFHFDPTVLGEAHSWNHNRARLAFERGANPIIIDNTNMQGWEMKPYVDQALQNNYKVLFKEPDTWWKNKPRELERRSTHRVPLETIRRMLCGYERFVTVKSIMDSQMPERKQQVTAETIELGSEVGLCPDLVGKPSEKNNKSHSEVVSPLPDVSTTYDSNYFGCTEKLQDNADMDMGALDSELDGISVNQVIPDCIVESIMSKDHCNDEFPVAFSESIGQRVKRKRADRRSSLEGLQSRDVLENSNKSEDEGVSQEREYTAEVKLCDFEGDWPSSGLLDQRQARRHGRQHDNNDDEEAKELHKHIDLFETGVASIYIDCSPSSSLSPSSSRDELNNDVKAEGRSHEPHRSQSEYQMQNRKNFSKVELPDCVSDSKATEMTLVRENKFDINTNAGHNATVQKSTENNKETWVKKELVCGEVCESPEYESLVETESSQMGDVSGSQEQKQRCCRRSGKPCKLALTFTQNCPVSSMELVESIAAAAQTDDEPNCELKPDCNLCSEPNMKPDCEACPSSFTQTESQDFAILWRVNHQDNPNTSDFRILCSNPTRFVSEMSCATAAIQPTNHKEVPYYVVHEKSTQVEEKELGSTQDRLEILHILRRHFKLVTLDTLEDLFEKCQQDIEWTTNLLLDSGEKFFRDDEGEEDRPCTGNEDTPVADHGQCYDMLYALKLEEHTGSVPDVVVEEIQHSTSIACEPCFNTNNDDSSAGPNILDSISVPQEKNNTDSETILLQSKESVPESECRADLNHHTQLGVTWQQDCEEVFDSFGVASAERIEGLAIEVENNISSMGEVHQLLQAELEELEREGKDREEKVRKENVKKNREQHVDIKSVELKLPTELALQLTELFGPVGIDPGSPEDYVLQMDLNLAKLLHQKWKESVQERQKQAALSFHLLQESSAHWKGSNPGLFQVSSDGSSHLDSCSKSDSRLPFMDHWNVSQPHVSLRNIIKEELALQENREKARQSQVDLGKHDGTTLLKEDQLFTLFPTIDRHFLQDIFRDHNYSLTQTELFLHSLLDEGPVKTVVAPEVSRISRPRAASAGKEKKPVDSVIPHYQDTEDPEYQDLRAEANLQRKRRLESFAKAAEAYKQGHKEVASFYAQQGHLHGQRMREANHRAAIQIFERVNSSLLPRNILDLHGLHVDEALEHLTQVLEQKTTECELGRCRPQLSVITGRGNHSQGGVARIRPAVIDYLTNKHYRFTEPKPGLVLVSLK